MSSLALPFAFNLFSCVVLPASHPEEERRRRMVMLMGKPLQILWSSAGIAAVYVLWWTYVDMQRRHGDHNKQSKQKTCYLGHSSSLLSYAMCVAIDVFYVVLSRDGRKLCFFLAPYVTSCRPHLSRSARRGVQAILWPSQTTCKLLKYLGYFIFPLKTRQLMSG